MKSHIEIQKALQDNIEDLIDQIINKLPIEERYDEIKDKKIGERFDKVADEEIDKLLIEEEHFPEHNSEHENDYEYISANENTSEESSSDKNLKKEINAGIKEEIELGVRDVIDKAYEDIKDGIKEAVQELQFIKEELSNGLLDEIISSEDDNKVIKSEHGSESDSKYESEDKSETETNSEVKNFSVAASEARLEKLQLTDLESIPPPLTSDMTPLNTVRKEYCQVEQKESDKKIVNPQGEIKESEEIIASPLKPVFIDPTDEVEKLHASLEQIGKATKWLSLQKIAPINAKMDGVQLENRLNKINEIKTTLNEKRIEKLKNDLTITINNLDNNNNLDKFDPELYPKDKMKERLEKCRQVLKKINDEQTKLTRLEAATRTLIVERVKRLTIFDSMSLELDKTNLENGNYELVSHQAFEQILKYITGNESTYFQKLRQHAVENPKKRHQIELYLGNIKATSNLKELFIALNEDPKLSLVGPSMRQYVPSSFSWFFSKGKSTSNEYAKSLENDLIHFIKRTYPEVILNKESMLRRASTITP